MKNLRALMLEEEDAPRFVEGSNPVLGYELQFLSNDKTLHKVEVRSLNFQDVIRHLRQGEAVLITPKLQENLEKKKQYQGSWYFTHS